MFDFNTLPQLLDHIRHNIKTPSYLNYRNNGKWISLSSAEFVETVARLSGSFSAVGVEKGTTVGIMSPSSPYWLMVDFALQELGAVSVPVFSNIALENLDYEIEDAGIEYLFVSNVQQCSELQRAVTKMKKVITGELCFELHDANVIMWDDFLNLRSEGRAERAEVGPDDLATIVYTSGSTGQPKGVELTHDNLVVQIKDASVAVELKSGDIALSLLPLAHIFERTVMLYYLASGIKIYFVDDVQKVGELIKELRPSVMLVVPRLLEKIYAKIHLNVDEAPFFKRLVAKTAFWRARLRDPDVTERNLIDSVFDRLVYRKLLDALGGNFRVMICGGAPLSGPISKFFLNIGLPLYQGYGLTEASPVISTNRPGHNRWGSSGQKFDHVEMTLTAENELLVRGRSVMRGYHNKPLETAKVIDGEGWLHTGDLASIDVEGYITIVSRLKELYKSSTGKYISAVKLESALMHSKWIEHAMVVADAKAYVTALLFIDPQTLAGAEGLSEAAVRKIVAKRVMEVNSHFNEWERIRDFLLISETPNIESGLLTPSMKMVRGEVYRRYENEIESMYRRQADEAPGKES